ncbi:MAG TPA: PDZ domain-containing protein [Pyrinomonadaceae bacterium]|jgi:membrane-associated protease RseP (regulator of RpoE activity)
MQPEPKRVQPLSDSAGAEETITCANCRAAMPRQMRFCRACGFRLGEGLAEYVETVRLPNQPTGGRRETAIPEQPPVKSSGVDWNTVAQTAHRATDQALQQASAHLNQWEKKHGRRRVHWIVWLVLALVIGSVTGGSLLSPFGLRRSGSSTHTSAPLSYLGLDNFKNGTGGVTFDYVTPPGGPADKAGLLGGDIITTFDGQPVRNTKDLSKLLEATPVGKTVDVTFIRDGETKQTQMTTISEDEQERLEDLADDRPEGEGYIAEGYDIDVVPAPGTNHNGVRLNDISENKPADIAGLRDGDIVIEFDGLPMRTRRELESRIVRAMPRSTVKVVVIRGTERLEIPVKIGHDD